MTVGGQEITLPFDPKWPGILTLINDAKDVVNLIIALSSVVAVGMIIVSGYTFITAAGNPDKIEQAQKTLTAAVVGLVIVWIAGLIVKFVLGLLNIT